MIVLKGGISSGYKKFIAEKNLNDETYTSDGIALIQISGTSIHNNKAVQVDPVSFLDEPFKLSCHRNLIIQEFASIWYASW